MELISDDGRFRVEWVELGEGWNGDYDPDNPNDQELLRFDCYVKADAFEEPSWGWDSVDEGWADPGNASYCTQMPANAPEWMKKWALECILREFSDAYGAGGYKRALEWMSWIGPDDFKGKEPQHEQL